MPIIMQYVIENTCFCGTYDFQHIHVCQDAMDTKALAMELTLQVSLQEITCVVTHILPPNSNVYIP